MGCPRAFASGRRRIEETDPERSFRVGIVYGPSGCGKSSLVKAGLLPRLDHSVVKVYVEASGGETEDRLLRNLRRQLPDLNQRLGLAEALTALRRGQRPCRGRQGAAGDRPVRAMASFARRRERRGTDPGPAAMRRDPRPMPAHGPRRLLAGREPLHAGPGDSLVRGGELASGRPFRRPPRPQGPRRAGACLRRRAGIGGGPQPGAGRLPRSSRCRPGPGRARSFPCGCRCLPRWSSSKPWTPSALREIGGAEGVGAAFLEETFSSPTAPPHHRLQQKTAQAVLAALLPEAGTDIRGHMRWREELLDASGCRNRPRQFDEVIALLDNELRLVTPSDSESLEAEGSHAPPPTVPREELPIDARLSRSLAADLADAETEGHAARQGRTAARRSRRVVDRKAGEPPPALALGISRHPLVDRQEELDRAPAEDDGPGRASAWHSLRLSRRPCCWSPVSRA